MTMAIDHTALQKLTIQYIFFQTNLGLLEHINVTN